MIGYLVEIAFWWKSKMYKMLSFYSICFIYNKESRNDSNLDMKLAALKIRIHWGLWTRFRMAALRQCDIFQDKKILYWGILPTNKQSKWLFFGLYMLFFTLFTIQRSKLSVVRFFLTNDLIPFSLLDFTFLLSYN